MRDDFLKIILRWPCLVKAAVLMGILFVAPGDGLAGCGVQREWLRRDFKTAKENGDGVLRLLQQINSQCAMIEQAPAIARAYYGALLTLEAKYCRNPARKLLALNQGMALLDQAVFDMPEDLEVVFLRFAALHSMPSFLSNRAKRTSDLKKVFHLLGKRTYQPVDKSAQRDMAVFLLESDRLSREEETVIKKLQMELSGL